MTAAIIRADARRLPLPDASVDAVVTDPPYALPGGFMGKTWDRFDGREDAGFAYWLMGLIDGEGHFGIKRQRGGSGSSGHVPFFAMKMRADERATLERIRRELAIGQLQEEPTRLPNPMVKWVVQSKPDCQRLVDVIDKYGLRAKKRMDYAIWREAVCEWTNRPRGNRWQGPADNSRMTELKQRIETVRTYVDPPWSGHEFQDWCRLWSAECLRVLKPGGYMVAFGSTRTWHRLACAIEDAGFEIRESTADLTGRDAPGLMWIHGQGFPKSKNHLKPAWEPIVLARRPLAGTVVANVLEHGTGALNIDGCRVEAGQDYRDKCASVVGLDSNRNGDAYGEWTGERTDSAHSAGRWPTNLLLTHCGTCDEDGPCAPGCPVAELDRQSGVGRTNPPGSRSAGGQHGTYSPIGAQSKAAMPYYGDEGGASRFFPVFRYEAKASSAERPRLPDGTAHPTVKPLALMRWLVRLITPPGGTVLDPFGGTGTTGEAALIEGFRAVVIELDPVNVQLAAARLAKPIQPTLGGLFDLEAM